MKGTRFLVLFSDPHAGASNGLMPPSFETFEGQTISQSPYQRWTWKRWNDFWKSVSELVGDEPFDICANGDLIDGNHHNTRELISPNTDDHVEACLELITEHMKKADRVYVTEGTNVHTQNSEHGIARALLNRGVNVVRPSKKKFAWPTLDVRMQGILVGIDHHVSAATSSISESAAFSRTIADVVNKRNRASWRIPRVFIRSHRHVFGSWSNGYEKMICLPSWQGLGRFVHRVAPGSVPHCGGVVLEWKKFGVLPIVHEFIYTPLQSPSIL